MPSGFMSSTFCAGHAAGTTVTLHPADVRRRRMLCLMPKSYATTCAVSQPQTSAARVLTVFNLQPARDECEGKSIVCCKRQAAEDVEVALTSSSTLGN